MKKYIQLVLLSLLCGISNFSLVAVRWNLADQAENFIDWAEQNCPEAAQEWKNTLGKAGLNYFSSAIDSKTNKKKEEERLFQAKIDIATMKEKTKAETEQQKETIKARTEQIKELVSTFFDDKARLTRVAVTAVSIAGGVYLFKNALPIARKLIEDRLFTPAIIDETSIGSGLPFFKKKSVESGLKELHFADALQAKINYIVNSYQRTSKQGGVFLNYLFYGEPGTGKTASARAIALESGLDYAIMSGGNVQKLLKSGKAEQRLKEVFSWAQKSKKGLLLFIDEADAFLKDPNGNEMSEELYSVLNSFLNLTGTENKKLSFILSTNHPQKLPKAVMSRIGAGQFVYFGCPDFEQRVNIINQFVPKYFTEEMRREFSVEVIKEIARRFDGFSGRDISYALLSLSHQDIFGAAFQKEKLYELIDQIVEQNKMKDEFHTFA